MTVVAIVSSCGESQAPVAVRIGEVSIGRGAVDHWAKAIGLGQEVASPGGRAHGTARERAVDFIISSNWLIGEAADRGLAVSDVTVEHRLQERIESVPNGKSEFEQELASLGQTIDDVKLEIEAEAAAVALARMVSEHVRPVTGADVADYYGRHHAEFGIREVRVTDLIESIPTRADAVALAKRIGAGRRFARMALHEHVESETPYEEAHQANGRLIHTIFTATPGMVAGPVEFQHAWVIVVVRKVVPARVKQLAAVREEIGRRLTEQRRRLARQAFVEAYRRKWVARTDCYAGYVVQKCSQYRGHLIPEPDPLSYRRY